MADLAVTAAGLALRAASFPYPRLQLQCVCVIITITRTMIDNLNVRFVFPFSSFVTLSTPH